MGTFSKNLWTIQMPSKTLPREKDGLQVLSLRNFYVSKTAQFSGIKPHNSVALICDISKIQNKIFSLDNSNA